jgi:ADP-ribosyl-[dinitrogen reductase] hydrolase
MSETSSDQIKGTLLGLAWGDVFGCPVETWSEQNIAQVYGRYDHLPTAYPLAKIASLGAKTVQRLRPLGLHSDDTQQALALINVGLQSSWSPQVWARWLTEGWKRRAWRG